MADPLSISAGVVGLVVPALHALRLLLDDIRRFNDAPRSIVRFKDDLESVEGVVCILQNLSDHDFERLGSDIQDRLKAALLLCKQSSLDSRQLLESCTRHSRGRSTLSLLDRIKVSLLADKEITEMSTQFQSTKATVTLVVNLATLSIAIRGGSTNHDFEENNHATLGTMATGQEHSLSVKRLPFRRDRDFVDRNEMQTLKSKMLVDGARVALVGLGGVGKSQLAIEYCFRLQTNEPNTTILWVHAGDAARYLQSMYDIAKQAKLDDYDKSSSNIFEVVGNWLDSTLSNKWFMVLDNLNDAGYLSSPIDSSQPASKCILDYIPTAKNGAILVTARSRQTTMKIVDTNDIISVSAMDLDTSAQLLAQKLNVEVDDDIKELADELDHIPLALAQAAAYLQKMRPLVQPRKLLQQLRHLETFKVDLLMADVPADLRRDRQSSNSTFLTWQIVFEQIKSQRPSAINLLSVLSFFDNKSIPLWLLRRYNAEYASNKRSEALNSVKNSSLNHQLELDLCLLQDFLFVSIEHSTNNLTMHDLVQMAAREWLRAQEGSLYLDSLQESLRLVENEFPQPKREAWPKCMRLFPHTTKLLAFDPGMEGASLEHWSWIAEHSIWFAIQCEFQEQELLVLVLPKLLSLELAAKSDPKYSDSDDNCLLSNGRRWSTNIATAIATIYEYKGDYAEAEKRRAYALEEIRKSRGDSHSETWTAVSNLASNHAQLGRYNEASTAFQKIIADRSATLGPNHDVTLTAMTNYARVSGMQSDYPTAGRVYQEIYERQKHMLSDDHPEVALSLWNVAVCEGAGSHRATAEEMMLRVIDVLGRTYKPDSLTLLRAQTELGTLYRLQGRWAQAVSLQKDVLEGKRKKLGDDHPDVLFGLAQLATTYDAQGHYDMAERIERDILKKRQLKLPENHEDVLDAMANLSETLIELDRLDEAEQLMKKALTIHPDHPLAMRTMGRVSRCLGRYEEASALNSKVLKFERKRYGDRAPTILSAMCNLAASRRDEGSLEEAERLATEAVETGESVWGPEHPHRMIAMTNLAETLTAQGRKQEAQVLLQKTLEVRTRTIGPAHPDTLKSVRLLKELDPVS